jgi:hypothetical protein
MGPSSSRSAHTRAAPSVVRGRRQQTSLGATSRARKPCAPPEQLPSLRAVTSEQVQDGGGADSWGSSTASAGAQPTSGKAAASEGGAKSSRSGQSRDPEATRRVRRRVSKDEKPDWASAWE